MLSKFIALIAFALAATTVEAGPFGLEMGMTMPQLRSLGVDVSDYKEGILRTTTVPKKHDSFEVYRLVVDAELGLCKIVAGGHTININAFGDQIKKEFEKLATALSSNYGKPRRFDFLKRGSIWDEAEDFAMGLYKEERVLSVVWMKE